MGVTDHLCHCHIHEVVCIPHLLLLNLHHIEITLISLSCGVLDDDVPIIIQMLVNCIITVSVRYDLVLVVCWNHTVQTFTWLDVFKVFLSMLLICRLILFSLSWIIDLLLIIFNISLIIIILAWFSVRNIPILSIFLRRWSVLGCVGSMWTKIHLVINWTVYRVMLHLDCKLSIIEIK